MLGTVSNKPNGTANTAMLMDRVPQDVSKHDRGWRKVVRNFTPGWFSVNMGTGIVSILLNTLPYNAHWIYWISVVVFVLNVLLFAIFLVITFLRFAFYPELFRPVVTHPFQSMYIGTFPMGITTMINMFCFVCVPAWGHWSQGFIWGIWIFVAVFSVLTALLLPFILMSHGQDIELSKMTAVWLLPIVTCVVASSSGAVVADVLSNAQHALWTILASYILWGIGVPFAMMVMVIYLHRLTLHKLPAKSVIVSAFLPLGPLGQGSFGIMKLGSVAQKVLPKTHSLQSSSPDIFYTAGFLIGIILWSFGLVWFFFAVASIFKTRTFPFNIGWWGFTFPIGVFATGTCQMGQELPSTFFNVLGTIISLCVVILWMVVSIGTIRGIITGTVFYDQVVAEYDGKEEDKRQISMTKGVYSA